MSPRHVLIIGAGMAGLSAALALAAHGVPVTVVERADRPGGKMREVAVDGHHIDSGPTVLTMRWVFDDLLASIGERLDDHLSLQALTTLARHAWTDGSRLDLFADRDQTIDAIGQFAGRAEAEGFKAFSKDAQKVFDVLRAPFICASAPSMLQLLRSSGFRDLTAIQPFQTLWKALGGYFRDPRLRQLFARYATYCGSSPFAAPATLMLVAHVESAGVWVVGGGMYRLAATLADIAAACAVRFRYGSEVSQVVTASGRATGVRLANGELIEADSVLVTADVAALAKGLLGQDAGRVAGCIPDKARSLSAVTWSCVATADGFPLARHSVFFSRNYPAEFDAIFNRHQIPDEPTVYVCAQDRDEASDCTGTPERLFILVNAPAIGDRHCFEDAEISECAQRTFGILEQCGLQVKTSPQLTRVTTPTDFASMFPATGGALYGRSSHGWMASFQRPGARTRIPRLYLAGGSAHPGPGVPMAALSGMMAAESMMQDLGLIAPSATTAMRGGMSTR